MGMPGYSRSEDHFRLALRRGLPDDAVTAGEKSVVLLDRATATKANREAEKASGYSRRSPPPILSLYRADVDLLTGSKKAKDKVALALGIVEVTLEVTWFPVNHVSDAPLGLQLQCEWRRWWQAVTNTNVHLLRALSRGGATVVADHETRYIHWFEVI